MSQTRQNLAAARELILKHLKTVEWNSLNHSEEVELFMELLTSITSIMTESGYLEAESSLANYWEKKEKDEEKKIDLPYLTQNQLASEAQTIVEKMTLFTYEQTQKIYFEINHGKYQSLLTKHNKILNTVSLNISTTIQNINPEWQPPTYTGEEKNIKIQSLPENKNDTHQLSQGLYYFTNILNGFYIPLNQSLDPLNGDAQGYCFGHVLSWSDEISKKGRYTSPQLSISPELDHEQIHQKEDKYDMCYFHKYHLSLDLYSIIDNILKNIDTTFTFSISLRSQGNTGHACGIRKIPSTNEIEFFDPNYGIFVFKTEESFRIWFLRLLQMSYFDKGIENSISLIKINKQTNDATASIPYQDIQPFSEQDKEKMHKHFSDHTIPNNIKDKVLYICNKIRMSSYITLNSEQKDSFKKADDFVYKTILNTQQALKNNPSNLITQKSFENNELTDDSFAIYKKNMDAYHDFLKKQVCDKINIEIGTLTKSKNHPNEIKALNHLKDSINEAGPHIALNAIIDRWLFVINKESKTSHHDLIKKLPGTYGFISFIRSQYETSPFISCLSQDRLLLKIFRAIQEQTQHLEKSKGTTFFNTDQKLPTTLGKINQYILDYMQNKLSASEALEKIGIECRKKKTGLISNILVGRNTTVASIYNLLKTIKPDNIKSLNLIYEKLNTLSSTNNLSSPSVTPKI
ncbi:MAG: hypothetical protein JO131_08545 [Gammaproteobacteria bacterium]|nr:hypothetical protein [Gammaproteobacteria bacterium]